MSFNLPPGTTNRDIDDRFREPRIKCDFCDYASDKRGHFTDEEGGANVCFTCTARFHKEDTGEEVDPRKFIWDDSTPAGDWVF